MRVGTHEPAAAPVAVDDFAGPAVASATGWTRFLVGFALVYGVLAGGGAVDPTGRWGLAILAAVLVSAAVLERITVGAPVSGMLRRLGVGRPGWRALALAAAVSGVVLLVFPLTEAVSGVPLHPRAYWPWLLVGLFAFHGVAEELVWRGYAFRRLRAGRTFRGAMAWTMPLIAATHLQIVFTHGPAVGLGAMLVAAVTALPLGYLYETGRRTVWAPALVHTAIDAFKLFVIPAAALSIFTPLIILAALLVPLLVLTVPRRLLTGDHAPPEASRGLGSRPGPARDSTTVPAERGERR